ncbi:carbon-nitrogen hydrolase [Nocardioides sp. MAH-18]|uniref:Carbon-nitrogen hydrolase n=1 Tax=Nocardioides agri TaxID=2682843 RepID=A0A6L6XMN9_9ACTN|nr:MULTISPECIES: carbon-nitrogen hydrolase family protein [unclassified Nocardioides]MBA2953620.1 carbon-nitrogen hydrolase family protein [Nocardioides sp. CGMCC 1.13656]MVQ48484.1 carbon-nitrogen hydrolase [Nocardioides sp. MAH-18]
MPIVRVAAVQFAVTEDVEENLATCLRMTDRAVAEGAEVVVLPEFCNHVSWYDDRDHARRMAQTLDGAFVAALAAKAREHGIHLMANCTLAREDGRTTGSNILFSPAGGILAVTDKQVLMGSERDHLDPAVEPSPIVDVPFGRVGLYSCMDGVINETPRLLGVAGAQVLLNSLNSFALDEASLHVPVRAVENRVWVVAANKVGPLVPERSIGTVAERVGVPVEMLHGAGEAQIVAPDGTVVAIAPRTGEAVVVADIEVAAADDKRRPDGTDVMASRRPDLYGPILEAPRGRQRPAGAEELVTAVVSPADGDDVAGLLASALDAGAALVVLPELTGLDPDAIVAALAGSSAVVATSVADGAQHVGLVLSAAGVLLRQTQLHACARHGWSTELGKGVEVADLPWGRLALVVGDDALYPETFRLAALQDVDVVAVPFTVQAAADLDPLLLERAAENRVNVAVASRRTPYGGGALYPLSTDFTLWAPGRGPFRGIISRPDPVLATGPVEVATLRPACATNRFVSKGTDVVDGRPWDLAGVLVAPVASV